MAILLFRGVGEESGDLPTVYTETSKYMWCNSRECILALHGEAHDNKFIMTKDDHALISEKLPVLKAKDSRRAKLEEKEKQEKIKQLKAGDPKDMTVILLREVLLEMGIPFKSSDTKTKLIEKVVEARSTLNLTCVDNTGVDIAPTTSENVLGQDNPRAIAEHDSTISAEKSGFTRDHQSQFYIETRFDVFEIPIFCDFDLKKKIILLIYLLFLLSMMNASQMTEYVLQVIQVLLSVHCLMPSRNMKKL